MSEFLYIAKVPTPAKDWARPRRSDALKSVGAALKQVMERYPNARKFSVDAVYPSKVDGQVDWAPTLHDYRDLTKAQALELIRREGY